MAITPFSGLKWTVLGISMARAHRHYIAGHIWHITHRQWVRAAIPDAGLQRESQWTQAVAVGSESFVAAVKQKMRVSAIGRQIRPSTECSELRDAVVPYNCDFKGKKSDMGLENRYIWSKSTLISD